MSLSKGERSDTGGKRPREIYRNLPGPPNFAVVNFLSKKGEKTSEQEVVPMCWIRNGKRPKCDFPADTEMSRRHLNTLVTSEAAPNDKDFVLYPVRILYSNCTYAEANAKFEQLAVKSSVDDEAPHSDHEDSDNDKAKRRKRATKTGSKKRSPKPDEGDSFEFDAMNTGDEGNGNSEFDSDTGTRSLSAVSNPAGSKRSGGPVSSSSQRLGEPNTTKTAGGSLLGDSSGLFSANSCRLGEPHRIKTSIGGTLSENSSGMFSVNSKRPNSHSKSTPKKGPSKTVSLSTSVGTEPSGFRRTLFGENTSSVSDYVSQDQFEVFERKLFSKLNKIQQTMEDCFANIKTLSPAQALISFPASISGRCSLPAIDVKTLEELDLALKDSEVRADLASYLSQLGGKNHSDFLARALPKIVSDLVCCYTNWSGSKIAAGTVDLDGTEILREFKKTFANLTKVVQMFCEASRKVCSATTDKEVECFIKKWLLSYKDRVAPRSHNKAPNTGKSPRKPKGSPRKKNN